MYDLVCWKIFCFWVKSILGNYETTLYSYFLSGDIDWYGYRWTDVHCFYKGLFDEIYDGPLLIAEKILLSHEPVYALSWCLNIHGHDHSNIEPYKIGCKHLNLAANVCGYMPVSLGKLIKEGILSDILSIYRITIDQATGEKKNGEAVPDN